MRNVCHIYYCIASRCISIFMLLRRYIQINSMLQEQVWFRHFSTFLYLFYLYAKCISDLLLILFQIEKIAFALTIFFILYLYIKIVTGRPTAMTLPTPHLVSSTGRSSMTPLMTSRGMIGQEKFEKLSTYKIK